MCVGQVPWLVDFRKFERVYQETFRNTVIHIAILKLIAKYWQMESLVDQDVC